MKTTKRLIAIVSVLLISVSAFAQQDAQYSQYMFNGIYINPAYAGYKEVLNLHSYYRNQWTGIEGAPRSFSAAVDAIANSGNVGLALQVASDRLGAQRNLMAYGSYAYRIRMNEEGSSRLAFGFSAGILQLGLDASLLRTNDMETDMPVNNQTTILPDARVGAFFANDRFFAGFSVDNLVTSLIDVRKYAYVPQPVRHYYLTAGALIPINENIQLKPSFLIKDDRRGPISIDLNAFLLVSDMIWIGGSYRTSSKIVDRRYLQDDLSTYNSAVAAVEVFPNPSLRIGYAYDFSIGPLRGYSGGAHEISVAYLFNKRQLRMTTPRVF